MHGIAEDTAGNLWIANQNAGSLSIVPRECGSTDSWTKLGHKDSASALAADPLRGGLWLGFFQGGIAYFSDGQVRASYSSADGLGEGQVSSLRYDRDGALWATTEGGLSRLKDGRIATLTSKNGLPCDGLHWMVEDDAHSLWLYMPCGLVRIVRSELDAWLADPKRTIQATVFDSSDGVRNRAIGGGLGPQVTKSSDGKLWFRSLDGVGVIDPSHLFPLPIGRLRMPPLLRDLEIDYTALSLVVPDKVLFRLQAGRPRSRLAGRWHSSAGVL